MDAITTDEIEARWTAGPRSHAGNVEMWDSQADKTGYLTVPSVEEDAFLRLLDESGALHGGIDILDIGCGAGVYSMALSSIANRAVGIDISPRMIESGQRLVSSQGIRNVQLSCGDWNEADVAASSFERAFDLVFAHNTPALSSFPAFQKLVRCSRGFCAACAPTSMDEPVLEELRAELGGRETFDRMRNMVFMLDYLLISGAHPSISYEDAMWPVDQPVESAIPYYVGKLWTPGEDREQLRNRVEELLLAKAEDERIKDTIHAVSTMVVWRAES